MSILRKREIPIIITLVVGVITIVDYFVKFAPINTASTNIFSWAVILASFALCIGLISLVFFHIKKISKKGNGWMYSLVTLATMVIVLAIGLGFSPESSIYKWLYMRVFSPLQSTTFALLAFYILSAAYRAFRVRNIDSALLLIAAIFVILNNAPIGSVIWPGFPTIGTWIMQIPNASAYRGITIGAALGAIALGIRTLTGRERGFLGRRRDVSG